LGKVLSFCQFEKIPPNRLQSRTSEASVHSSQVVLQFFTLDLSYKSGSFAMMEPEVGSSLGWVGESVGLGVG
jgi:hypothetical protein